MRRSLFGSWKRPGVQLGLLVGVGWAFAGPADPQALADDGGKCPVGEQCSFKKPNLLVVMDYSSSMNREFVPGQTRWEAAVEAVQNIATTNNGFFDERAHIALLRYGHDPDPATDDTPIAGDTSNLRDGQSLDVAWYDAQAGLGAPYFECNGDAVIDFLENVDPPLCIGLGCSGIGTWTEGALEYAREVIAQSRADHPEDTIVGQERAYTVVLITDGRWSSQEGFLELEPEQDDPVPVAGALNASDGVDVYVVAFGDAVGEDFADDLALAGGTTNAIDAGAGQLVPALETVLDDIEQQVIVPECTGGLPRLMVILDASSSMLNVGEPQDADNYSFGALGQTGWDQAREALAGVNSLFDEPVTGLGGIPVEDLIHMGIMTFGNEGDERLLVNYGPCMKDNFSWALDPRTSCDIGCNDPWSGPPIIWTPQTPESPNYPGFDAPTHSAMPFCDIGMYDTDACTGSATATHAGLQLAAANIADYRDAPLATIDDSTVFANILITDGQYSLNNWSTDEQVSAALMDLYMNAGVTTYVIGFGDSISTVELANMACWGSGGSGIPCTGGSIDYFDVNNQSQLSAAMQEIVGSIPFDPCCAFNDCSFNPEPTTGEPDPVQGESGGDETASDEAGTTAVADAGGSDAGEGGDAPGGSTTGAPADGSGIEDGGGVGSSGGQDQPTSGGADTAISDTDVTPTPQATGEDLGCGCRSKPARIGGPFGGTGLAWMFILALGAIRRRP